MPSMPAEYVKFDSIFLHAYFHPSLQLMPQFTGGFPRQSLLNSINEALVELRKEEVDVVKFIGGSIAIISEIYPCV
jgi:hypothetical protein